MTLLTEADLARLVELAQGFADGWVSRSDDDEAKAEIERLKDLGAV